VYERCASNSALAEKVEALRPGCLVVGDHPAEVNEHDAACGRDAPPDRTACEGNPESQLEPEKIALQCPP
jgi:hypothetical protein